MNALCRFLLLVLLLLPLLTGWATAADTPNSGSVGMEGRACAAMMTSKGCNGEHAALASNAWTPSDPAPLASISFPPPHRPPAQV